jgi:hypothetical protein
MPKPSHTQLNTARPSTPVHTPCSAIHNIHAELHRYRSFADTKKRDELPTGAETTERVELPTKVMHDIETPTRNLAGQ